ncbi:MAG: protein translocase subunit SecD [Verrucomicrobiota bacterium]
MNAYVTFLVGSAILLLLLFYLGSVVHSTKRKVGTVLIILMALFSILTVKNAGIPLGIDLKGGSEFVVRLKPSADKDGVTHSVTADEVQQAIKILEKRLNPESTKDLSMQPQGSDRILIQMPGVKPEEFADVRTKIQQVAKLEFRVVHQDSRSKIAEIDGGGLTEPGWVKMSYKKQTDEQGKVLPDRGAELVRGRPDMEGDGVSNAFATMDAEGWKVYLDLNTEGAKQFDAIAAVNKGRQLAIIVDNEIISAPTLQTDHFGGTAVISGNFNRESSVQLATLLKNPLKNPMQIESENAVSASYGQSSIDQGKWICIAGLAMTTIFMLFIYRMAGLIAIVGLVINLVVLFGGMALFQFTLTMPGIAGVVLTIGMAVDANVLIYERLREEMEAGKTLTAALEAAYEKAFSAIADSNITTIIAAIILLSISGGLVAGFAVTLLIGLVSSLLGALVVTRVIFMWVIDKGILTSLKTTKIIPDKVFDILSKAPKFIIASLVVTAISFGTLAFKGGNSFGIDFRGGSLLHIELRDGKKISDKELEDVLKPLTMKVAVDSTKTGAGAEMKDVSVGTFYLQRKSTTTGGEIIAVRGEQNAGPAFEGAVNAKFKDSIKGTSLETVGSLIGQESGVTSIIAMGIALIAIFVYLLFRYEFAFALGAVVALFHDVLMVPGLCVLFGQELSLIHVGALLTIAGYSINDTIVVFDRIRETIQRGGGGSIRDLMNEAICKTLSRTLLTGPTALAPMIILLFLGNPAMLEFAMPITIGVLLGTYSSIFIASPLVLWYATKTGVSLKHKVLESHEAARMADAAVAASKASGA